MMKLYVSWLSLLLIIFETGCSLPNSVRGWVAGGADQLQVVNTPDQITLREGESHGLVLSFKNPAKKASQIRWVAQDPNHRLNQSQGVVTVSSQSSFVQIQLSALANSIADGDEDVELSVSGSDLIEFIVKVTIIDQTALAQLQFAVTTVNFGTYVVSQTATTLVTLSNVGGSNASGLASSTLASPFRYTGGIFPGTAGNCTSSLPASSSCTVELEFAPVAAGTFSTPLSLSYNDGRNSQTAQTQLNGVGSLVASNFVASTLPALLTNASALAVEVSSDNSVVQYRYKIETSAAQCTSATGYSSSRLLSTLITDNIAALADGNYSICLIGFNGSAWQSLTTPTVYTFAIDHTPPSAASIVIASGAGYTQTSTVTLALSSVDASTMLITQNPDCSTGGVSEAYTTAKTWNLSSSQAINTVYAKFIDGLGNSVCVSDSITWDQVGPLAVSGVTIGQNPVSLSRTPTVSFASATDAPAGVDYHQVQIVKVSDSSVVRSWSTANTGDFLSGLTLLSGENYRFEIRGVDRAGNAGTIQTSTSWKALSQITATLSGVPSSTTNVSTLNVLVAGDLVTQYFYKVGLAASVDCSSTSGYSSAVATSTHIANALAADGVYKLCVIGSDGTTAQPYASATAVTWALDTQGPVMPSLTINGVTSGYTQSVLATLAPTAIDAFEMYITNVSGCGSGGVWEPYALSKSYTLSANTSQTIYIKFRDTIGNESACVSASMVHDNQNPNSATGLALGYTPVGLTSSPTLSWTATTDVGPAGIQDYQVRLLRSSDSSEVVSWQTFVSGNSLSSLSLTNGTAYEFELQARDRAGNMATSVRSSSFTAYSTLLATLTGTPAAVSNATALNVDVGGTGVLFYSYKVGTSVSTDCSVASGYSTSVSESVFITDAFGSAPDGVMKLCVIGSNGSQWQSYASATSFTWIKDTTGPTVSITTTSSTPTNVSPIPITLTFSESLATDLVSADITLTNGSLSNFVKQSAAQWTADLTPAPSAGAITVTAQLAANKRADSVGNMNSASNALSVVYDFVPPGLTISSPAANSEVTVANQSSFTVNGTCSENGQLVSITGSATGSVVCSGGAWSINLDFTSASLGTVGITATHTKASGATSNVARNFVKVANRAPVLATIADQSLIVNTAMSTVNPNDFNTGTDYDIDGQPITYSCDYDQTVDSIVSPGSSCTSLSGFTLNTATGVMNWTPTVAGVFEFKITGSDGTLSNSKFLVVTVTDITATLSGVPNSPTVDTALNVTVGGTSVTRYRFKVGAQSSTDCSVSTGYSAAAGVAIGTKITSSLTGYSIEQPLRLCVIGGTASSTWQSFSNATVYDWVQDRNTTVTPDVYFRSLSEGNTSSAQSITFSITNPKPSAMVISYNVYGTIGAGDLSLSTGSFTIPANSTTYTLNYTLNGNALVDGNRRAWVSLSGSNKVTLNFNTNQNIVIDIVDDESTVATFSKVTMGEFHGCGIVAGSGVLKCWGLNARGQVGDNTLINRSSPSVIDSGTSYSDVSAGSSHTCGIVAVSGILKCWGHNLNGQLGDNTTNSSLIPKVIDSGVSYQQVAASGTSTCGIVSTTGVLKCWGANSFGQLGDGTTTSRITPTVIDSGVSYSRVEARGATTCGIMSSTQQIKCWGRNMYGQVGDGTTTDRLSPVLIDSATTYSDLALAIDGNTCGIVTTTGVLKCWGNNNYYVLGDGTQTNRSTPVVIDSGTAYSRISLGRRHSCGVTSAGALKCWGSNALGQLGDLAVTLSSTPRVIDSGLNYQSLALGSYNSCGLLATSGTMKCWGENSEGQNAFSETTRSSAPAVVNPESNFIAVATGTYHSCGIEEGTRALKCWGSGILGDGTSSYRSFPTVIDAGTPYASIAAGDQLTCGVVYLTGVLKCWGDNLFGTVGDGSNTDRLLPAVVDRGTSYSSVSLSSRHACAIVAGAGAIKCWGDNFRGQVGDGTTTSRNAPVLIDAGTSYAAISVGDSHTCGIVNGTGQVKCWGYNVYGEIGDGSTTQRNTPVTVDVGLNYAKIMAGSGMSCGIISSSGQLRCWGRNNFGDLGDGTTTNRLSSVVIQVGVGYSDITSKSGRTVGVVASTGLGNWWGTDQMGSAADSSTTYSTTKTVLTGGISFSTISAGSKHSCGIESSSKKMYCWGDNMKYSTIGFGMQLGKGGFNALPIMIHP